METLAKRGLNGTQLKTIALVLMVVDHIHYIFGFTGVVPEWFSMVARLSAPLFLFCTVEGFAHTHDRKRYFLRIWAIGAGMAAVEFFMMYVGWFRRGDGFYPMNAIFQDFVLLCIVWQGMDWLKAKRYTKGALAIAEVVGWPFVVACFLNAFPQIQQMPWVSTVVSFCITSPLPMWTNITDGGWVYMLGGVVLYALRDRRKQQVAVWGILTFLGEFVRVYLIKHNLPGFVWTQMFTYYYEWYEIFAIAPMMLYNGKRGSGHKQLFYWFYPAHVYILYGASCLLYNALRCRPL